MYHFHTFQLVNLLSNDGQRIFEAVAIGPLMLPGPIMLLFGLIYTVLLIGPWAMVAMGLFIIFYPFMVSQHLFLRSNYFFFTPKQQLMTENVKQEG